MALSHTHTHTHTWAGSRWTHTSAKRLILLFVCWRHTVELYADFSAPTLRAGEPGETGASTGARMFSLLVGFWQLLFRRAEFHVLILGVDAAGKTTVLEQIKVRP